MMSKPMIEEQKKINFKLNISGIISNIKEKVISKKETEQDKFMMMLKEAHADWQNAQKFFDNTTEPDLIDYAIYEMEASKTRYRYLIKQAKKKNIKINL